MVFQDQSYSVLVVSASGKFNDSLAALLPEGAFHPVCFVAGTAAARRELSGRAYDFVIINAPLPDDLGVRFAMDTCAKTSASVLLLLRPEVYGDIREKVTAHGVFTLQKPIAAQTLQQCLSWMAAARERLRLLDQKNAAIEEQMEEIRLLNRAKWLLIEKGHMTESEAHRHIEKEAMDRCVSKTQIARQILREYL